jgi:hypothetical protein
VERVAERKSLTIDLPHTYVWGIDTTHVSVGKKGVAVRKVIAFMLIAAMLAGCTGSFELTRKVYNFHRSIENKWVDEIVFLVFCYVPVYVIAILADAIIFNSIEFWTCENPVKSSQGEKLTRVAMAGDARAVMTLDTKTADIKVDIFRGVVPVRSFVLAKDNEKVMIKDLEGNVMSSSMKTTDGGISLYDGKGRLARHFTPEAVQIARTRKLDNVLAKK